MAEALARAAVTPAEVDYLEAHGTGTQLGDAVEINAIASVYGPGHEADRPLLVGSVKTNIGHLEAAGGVAGVIKVLMAMQRGVIPKHLNFRDPNPDIDWEGLPVRVTSEPIAWPSTPGRSPLAAVNVFGISGSNAHVVIEGYGASDGEFRPAGSPRPVSGSSTGGVDRPEVEGTDARTVRLLPLSARAEPALAELAGRYLSWLDEHALLPVNEDDAAAGLLADMAWTAGAGRTHHPHRAAVVFDSIGSLRRQLALLAADGAAPEDRTDRHPTAGSATEGSDAYRELVEVFATDYEAGETVPFERLFEGETRRRVSLPTYPFQRISHWFE